MVFSLAVHDIGERDVVDRDHNLNIFIVVG